MKSGIMRTVKPLKVLFAVAVFASTLAGKAEGAPHFVGTDGCKCHKSEIADWERSRHANVFELLEPGKKAAKKKKAKLYPDKDYRTTTKCLKCHTTGYEEEGGFKDISSTPNMAGVGCEMCHGAGSNYRAIHKEKTTKFTREETRAAGQTYGSLDEAVCRKCHEHKDNPFKPEVDEKYKFNHEKALKNADAFHDMYPLEGKH